MGLVLGLDFGTTYSVLTRINEDTCAPEAISLSSENTAGYFYDTLVVRNKNTGERKYAQAARVKIGDLDTIAYRGFKLLLNEKLNDKGELPGYEGYDNGWTPRRITSEFLKNLLESFLGMPENRGESIEKLVIGVPLIWAETDLDKAYSELLDIIIETGLVEDVEFISEPDAACGYFAHNYKQTHDGNPFEGHLLLVDYGGGTLDITLCEISSNENGTPVTKYKGSAGDGANTDKRIGKAGLDFMREVIRVLLEEGGVPEKDIEEIEKRGLLDKTALTFESLIKEFGKHIEKEDEPYKSFRQVFKEIDEDKLIDIEGNDIPINGLELQIDIPIEVNGMQLLDPRSFSVTYGTIAKAYRRTIYGVLNTQLGNINKAIEKNSINSSFNNDRFRIQMVGGFCNFYLVEQQIKKFFGISPNEDRERRFEGVIASGDKRVLSVAYGAALKANELFVRENTFLYSIGVKDSEKDIYYWAVEQGDDLIEDRVYLFKDEFGNPIACNPYGLKSLWYIMYDTPQQKYMADDHLERLKFSAGKAYTMGISLDRHLIITVHWWEINDLKTFEKECKGYENAIFENRGISILEGHKSCKMAALFALDGGKEDGVTNLRGGSRR